MAKYDDYIEDTYKNSEEYLKLLAQFCLEQKLHVYFQKSRKITISSTSENLSSDQIEINNPVLFEGYRLWLGEQHEPVEVQDDDGEYYDSPFSEEDSYLQDINFKNTPLYFQEKLAFFIFQHHPDKDFCSFVQSEHLKLSLDNVLKLTNQGYLSQEQEYEFISSDRQLFLSSFLSKNKMDIQVQNKYSSIYDYTCDLLKNRSYEYKVKLLKSYFKSSFNDNLNIQFKDFLFQLFDDSSTRNHYFSQLYEYFPYLRKFVEPIDIKKEETIEFNAHLSQFSIEGLYYAINPKGVSSYHLEDHFKYVTKYLEQDNLKHYLLQVGVEHFYIFKPKYNQINFITHLLPDSKFTIESWENFLIQSIHYFETKEAHEKFERREEYTKSPLYQYLTTFLLELQLDNGQTKQVKKMKV